MTPRLNVTHLVLACAASALMVSIAHTQTAPLVDAPLPPARSSLPQLGLSADEQLTLSQERVLGRVIWRDMRAEPDVMTDPLVSDYLQAMITRLALPLGLPDEIKPRIFAVKDASLNAFAMPSGLMGVHTGLMLGVAREGELAAVLAHEIGHVSQRHFARGIANQKDNAWIGLAGFAAALVAARRGSAQSDQVMQGVLVGSQAVQASKQLAFSRDMEREADAVGLDLIKQAQYEGTDMVRMLRRLGAASSLNETGTVYARSHPGTTERMANIEGRLKIASTPLRAGASALDASGQLDFLLMQARVRALTASLPEAQDDATAYFETQLQADKGAAPLPARKASAHYGLALLALQKKQLASATQHLAQARALAAGSHPWLAVLALELNAVQGTADVAAFLADPISQGTAAGVHAILVAQRKAPLASSALLPAQSYLQQWLVSHPSDDEAWAALAAVFEQQRRPAQAAWAQAEQTAAMGVWASSITLLGTALRLSEGSEPATVQNHWRTRLQAIRQFAADEKTVLDRFK